MKDELRYAWAAGFLDGEGCFRVYGRKPSIRAGQVVREPLDVLATLFGGAVYEARKTCTGKVIYVWHVAGGTAARRVIPLLMPYLIVKREDAQRVYDFALGMRQQRVISDALRMEIRASAGSLRGISAQFGVPRTTVWEIRNAA